MTGWREGVLDRRKDWAHVDGCMKWKGMIMIRVHVGAAGKHAWMAVLREIRC